MYTLCSRSAFISSAFIFIVRRLFSIRSNYTAWKSRWIHFATVVASCFRALYKIIPFPTSTALDTLIWVHEEKFFSLHETVVVITRCLSSVAYNSTFFMLFKFSSIVLHWVSNITNTVHQFQISVTWLLIRIWSNGKTKIEFISYLSGIDKMSLFS